MKKIISLILALVMILSLAACSTDKKEPVNSGGTTGGTTGGETTSQISEKSWTLAIDSPEDTVTYLYAQKFAEEVSKNSNGKMKIQIFANGTLGGDRELLESVKAGNVNFVVQTTAPQVNFMPKLAVFDLPVAYQTLDEVRAALDNDAFMTTINGVYDEAGYKLLGYADQSFRVMSSNVKIENMNSFKGIKIRTMENSNHLAFWQALGANPAPMAFAEVYIGLQQGTIDAQENPYEVIVANKLYEQQKYVVQTNHLPHILSLYTSKDLYSGLTADEQKVLEDSVSVAKVYARGQADERAKQRMDKIEESGTEVITLSTELYNQIKEAVKPVYDSIRGQVGDELVDAYLGQ